MSLQVSVIIPVYNTAGYVREALRSVRAQSIEPDAVEIIAVDDGSTDGSGEILAEFAAEDPRMTVITQENSGTPGGARNPAIESARGEYVFFLDADDLLTPDALRGLVETAEAEGSDVVLGKIGSLDGRHAPASMFKRTVLDADLLEDNVFNTLGPTKLIRRSLIERLGLRFPTDQKVGEDQPFMAAAYLAADKISVLADQDYYLIRHRDDGTNMTLGGQPADAHLKTAIRLAHTIEEHTEPGERRDALMRRPFGWSMRRVLDGRWSRLERTEQEGLADRFRAEIGHLYTTGVRDRVLNQVRVALDLLSRQDLDGLQAYTEHLAAKGPVMTTFEDGEFVWSLPPELSAIVPARDRVMKAPKISVRLEDVRIEGREVSVSATVRIPDFVGAPDSLGLRARQRDGAEAIDLGDLRTDLAPEARSFAVSGVLAAPPRGIWDLKVVIGFGDTETELRLGADRARALAPEGVSNLGDDPRPADRMIAYYTQGPGNLSIDAGGVLHRNLAGARAIGLGLDENHRAQLLVQLSSPPRPEDEFFAAFDAAHDRGARELLPAVPLGERLVGLRLPASPDLIGAEMTFSAVLGGASVPLPAPDAQTWPARAAGFGLEATESGTLVVTTPSARAAGARSAASGIAATARRAGDGPRGRAASRVKELPIVGPLAVRAVRAMRERRS